MSFVDKLRAKLSGHDDDAERNRLNSLKKPEVQSAARNSQIGLPAQTAQNASGAFRSLKAFVKNKPAEETKVAQAKAPDGLPPESSY